MNFRVDTQALRSCRSRLQDLSSDTSNADSYASTYLDLSGEDGRLFFHVDNVCRDVRARVDDVISRLASVLTDSGLELRATATWYDETDAATRERMDMDIPEPEPILPGDGYDDDAPFEDTVPEDPGDYTPPEDHEPPPADDDEMIMAPGPIGEPSTTPTGPVA